MGIEGGEKGEESRETEKSVTLRNARINVCAICEVSDHQKEKEMDGTEKWSERKEIYSQVIKECFSNKKQTLKREGKIN